MCKLRQRALHLMNKPDSLTKARLTCRFLWERRAFPTSVEEDEHLLAAAEEERREGSRSGTTKLKGNGLLECLVLYRLQLKRILLHTLALVADMTNRYMISLLAPSTLSFTSDHTFRIHDDDDDISSKARKNVADTTSSPNATRSNTFSSVL